MSSISWGMRNRYRFNAYGELERWAPPIVPGVFAITYRRDPQARPKSHTVLFFGEGGDLSKLSPAISSDIRNWWNESRKTASAELYVFVHPMPGSTQWDRARVQSELVAEYDPHGNA